MEALKNCARHLNFDDDRGYLVAVLIALVFISVLLAAYYPVFKPREKGFTTISLLDFQKKAIDYPELLIINQNNTFSVFVEVENHNESQSCTVLLKITDEMIHKLPFAANADANYTKTLEKEEKWEIPLAVTLDKPGDYSVIFELWLFDEDVDALKFSENACVLNVEVVNSA